MVASRGFAWLARGMISLLCCLPLLAYADVSHADAYQATTEVKQVASLPREKTQECKLWPSHQWHHH